MKKKEKKENEKKGRADSDFLASCICFVLMQYQITGQRDLAVSAE